MERHWDIKTIVLGYDGSEGAGRAAHLASDVAHELGARLVVVTVAHGPDVTGKGEMVGRVNPDLAAARATAQELADKLRGEGIDAVADPLEGHPSEAILRAAEIHGAQLIVIGRRGHGRLTELLLGSTSEYVVRRAKVPVLVAH